MTLQMFTSHKLATAINFTKNLGSLHVITHLVGLRVALLLTCQFNNLKQKATS